MSIKLVARLKCIPDAQETFELELKKLVEASVKEEGCLGYELYECNGDAGHYFIIDEWQNEKVLERHKQTPHYKNFFRVGMVLLAEPAEIKTLTRLA